MVEGVVGYGVGRGDVRGGPVPSAPCLVKNGGFSSPVRVIISGRSNIVARGKAVPEPSVSSCRWTSHPPRTLSDPGPGPALVSGPETGMLPSRDPWGSGEAGPGLSRSVSGSGDGWTLTGPESTCVYGHPGVGVEVTSGRRSDREPSSHRNRGRRPSFLSRTRGVCDGPVGVSVLTPRKGPGR